MERHITCIFAFAAIMLATSLALVSCAKQDVIENGSTNPAGGARTITVSFANASVKSALGEDGLTSKFVATDVIKVSNGTDVPEECTVSIDGSGNASITTELTGALTMVYPATAAKMNGNDIEGILVPTVQNGSFASANICKATIEEGATEATFENQTAVLKLQVPSDSPDYTATLVKVTPRDAAIAEGSKTITVGDGTSSVMDTDGYCYVAVLPGGTVSHMTVGAGYGCRNLIGDDVIAINKIYTAAIPVKEGHEYVEIAGLKWAAMNVGATKAVGTPSECFGDYFAWGETEPYYESINTDAGDVAASIVWKASYSTYGYHWKNYKYCKGTDHTMTKYCGNSSYGYEHFTDTKTVLESADDAATANWGLSWRMPTLAEYNLLNEACAGSAMPIASKIDDFDPSNPVGGLYWLPSDQEILPDYKGVAGYIFIDAAEPSKRVFFPAARYVDETSFCSDSRYAYYWSSSLNSGWPDTSYGQFICGTGSCYNGEVRCGGFSVRPVSE